ncbi:MAG: PhoPQ-activated pathogenicity-like protein PqaA type [Bacteroidetes bacterium]|nr:MAG: PhoPQ-activated pathogenicity-like protein PqaA type [Bacteroidota bacterium]
MKPILTMLALPVLIFSCASPVSEPVSSFPLKEYVMTTDDAFNYDVVETVQGAGWTEYKVKMISGTWLTEQEVNITEWWHWVNIIVPDKIRETESMIIIGGGSTNDTIPISTDDWLMEAAVATGSIISHVSNIPFQPIDFKGDDKEGRYEDDLIAYGWKKYLDSGASDENLEWLARFPMTRAVVRAMDVVQELSQTESVPVERFFVTGASKRGWTTWTTAAVDDRVMGIAPIVIDLLNIVPSFNHHWRCYGEWSPAVENYEDEGIMNWINTPEFKKLLEIVGPYSFREQLTMPKLMINATCDEFFVTDSWKFYWDELKGENYLQYVPNGNHGLLGTYQPASLISFYHSIISNTAIPSFSWNHGGDTIYMRVDPESDYIIRKWEAINESDRDFRIYVIGEAWQMEELEKTSNGAYAIHVEEPEAGYKAALVELIFNPHTEFPLTFTSGTLIIPDQYPYAKFEPPVLP